MAGEFYVVFMLNSQPEVNAHLLGVTSIYIELGMKGLFVPKMCTQLGLPT